MKYFLLLALLLLPFLVFNAYGDSITEEDSLLSAKSSYNSFVKIDSDTIALSHAGQSQFGYITTFDIDGSNNISQINSLLHHSTAISYNSIIKLDSGIYALAYGEHNANGFIKTFEITNNGVIIEVASFQHETSSNAGNFSIVQIDSNIVVLAYRGADLDAFIKTFDISNNGAVITELDSLEHHDNVDNNSNNSLIPFDSDTVVLAYAGPDDDGFIKTFDISTNGTISEIDSLEHDTLYGNSNSIVKVDSDTVVLAYTSDGDDGTISTFDISSSGIITEISSLEYDTGRGIHNSLIELAPNNFVLAYSGTGLEGIVKTFNISDTGTISELASLEHESIYGLANKILKLDSNLFTLTYAHYNNPIDTGYIKTFSTLPLIEEEIMTLYITNGTSNLYMCEPVE